MSWIVYAAIGVGLYFLLRWRLKGVRTEKGTAHWLKPWIAARNGLFGFSGVPVGDWGWFHLPVRFDDDGHILTVAPPGGGKSTTGSIPSGLARSIKARFVADPDGEVTGVCIDAWRRDCDAVYVINPAKMLQEAPWSLPAHRFDPMEFVRPEARDFGKRARFLGSALITQSDRDDGNTEYFKSAASNKLAAYIAFGALKGAALPQIRDWTALPVEGDAQGPYPHQLALWEEMTKETALDGMIAKAAVDLRDKYQNAPPEFQAVFSTMRGAVEFLDDPSMREAVSGRDVDWQALKKGRAVVALAMPRQDWKIFAPFVRLAFLSAVWTLEEGPVARHRVHILLEEFPTLGRLDFFSDVLATSRKKKGQIEVVVQNIGQFEALYPEWRALLPNFEVRRFKAIRDIETARYVSSALGRATFEYKHKDAPGFRQLASRDLMTTDELMAMEKDRQVAFIGNNRPAFLGQYPYWEKPSERARALPNPYYPQGAPPPAHDAWLRRLGGQGMRILSFVLGPHPVAAAALLALFLWGGNVFFVVREHYDPQSRVLSCSYFGWKGLVTRHYSNMTADRRCWRFHVWGLSY